MPETDGTDKIKLDVYEGYSAAKQDSFLCLREREPRADKKEDKEDRPGYFIGRYKISEEDMLPLTCLMPRRLGQWCIKES